MIYDFRFEFFFSDFDIRISDFYASCFARCSDSPLKRWRKLTPGSETSQYREEKKTIVIPLVAASETGEAQTQPLTRASLLRSTKNLQAPKINLQRNPKNQNLNGIRLESVNWNFVCQIAN